MCRRSSKASSANDSSSVLHRSGARQPAGLPWVPMIEQLIRLTPEAREKIDGVRTFNDFPEAVLRVRVLAKDGPRFRYEIALEDPRERTDADVVVALDGLDVAIDPDSAVDLAGATIDLDPAVIGGGLKVDNPNEGW